jgi:hypothetical protein
MKKISIVIFTYKRAMQLHTCLETLIKNFKNIDYPIHIIYHHNQEHEKSYLNLEKNFSNRPIIFYKRKKVNLSKWVFGFLRPLNLVWLLRWPIMIKERNNFKNILENILKKIKSDYVTLCPDDMIYFDKTIVSKKALQFIRDEGDNYQYRYFTASNLNKPYRIDKNLKKKFFEKDNKFFLWSFKDKNAKKVWKYRFTIEGTVYNTRSLLKFLKPIIYHNPITLEAIGLWEARIRNFFFNGLSSVRRTAGTYQVNNVQKIVKTPTANFDPNLLMKAYNLGYSLLFKKNDFYKNNHVTIPSNIFLKNKKNKSINYEKLKKPIDNI